jgi:hypothetical protein
MKKSAFEASSWRGKECGWDGGRKVFIAHEIPARNMFRKGHFIQNSAFCGSFDWNLLPPKAFPQKDGCFNYG